MILYSVRGAVGTQQHPGHTAFHVMSQCTSYPLSFRKKSILHREKVKRSMNVIFYLLFSVGWCWNFCSCHELVNQSCQDTSCFGFSLQWPLVPPVLTADVPQWFYCLFCGKQPSHRFPFTHCRAIFILKKKKKRTRTVTNLMGGLRKTI